MKKFIVGMVANKGSWGAGMAHRNSVLVPGLRASVPQLRVSLQAVSPGLRARARSEMSLKAGSGSVGFGSGGGGKGGNSGLVTFSGGAGDDGKKKGLWNAYLDALEKAPLLTKCLTCAVLNGVGDILSQTVFEDHPFDWGRLAKFMALGFAFVGPVLSIWYGWLATAVKAGGMQGAIIKLVADQGFFAPIFIGSFMSLLLALEGKTGTIVQKLKTDLPSAIVVNWGIWVPAQFINFRFVPPSLTVLVANIVAVVWNTYLSFVSNRTVPVPEVAKVAVAAAPKGGKK